MSTPADSPGFSGMIQFDVFGRPMGVEREIDGWRVYQLDSPGKRRDLTIRPPADLPEDQLGVFLADLFHESARPDRPDVRRL